MLIRFFSYPLLCIHVNNFYRTLHGTISFAYFNAKLRVYLIPLPLPLPCWQGKGAGIGYTESFNANASKNTNLFSSKCYLCKKCCGRQSAVSSQQSAVSSLS
jgi:hypothetical protein